MRHIVRCCLLGLLMLSANCTIGCGPSVDNAPVSQDELKKEAEAAAKAEAAEEAKTSQEENQ